MLEIDYITVISSVVLILSALLTPLFNPFFRKPRISESATTDEGDTNISAEQNENAVSENNEEDSEPQISNSPTAIAPPVSIVFTPNDDAETLSKNLSIYLSQDYPDYEVIVVAPQGDSETEDILKIYSENPRLYTTFIPESSRYMSRKKLAITLGVKAARNEWVLMADIFCAPQSDQWLKVLARHCEDRRNLVIGYTRYEDETPDFWRFERFHTACYLMREDQKGKPYRCNSNALLFRKSDFNKHDGFRGNLKYLRGEFDFIVNKYSHRDSLALENSETGTLIEPYPTHKHWLNKHLYYMENRQHLERSTAHRFLFGLDQTAMYLNYILIIVAACCSGFMQNWILLGAAGVALIVTLSMRMLIAKKVLTLFNEEIPAWKIIPFELRLIWQNLNYKIKYWRANKYDFISHKL
ncbi:glycosyltransferase [Prevotella sp. HUN102]|uniref:glycosyltransferase n=1 Tax=Prevotella sp. HUN102 TaxID=1392486 RepID=UPI000491FE90|nr:glycosyltransferase [Prevotella sp. HUN102]